MMPVGKPQEKSPVVRADGPDSEVTCRRHKDIAVVVRSAVQRVIFHVNVPARTEQLHLVGLSQGGENINGLLYLNVVTAELDVPLHEKSHPVPDRIYVLRFERGAVPFVNNAEKTF